MSEIASCGCICDRELHFSKPDPSVLTAFGSEVPNDLESIWQSRLIKTDDSLASQIDYEMIARSPSIEHPMIHNLLIHSAIADQSGQISSIGRTRSLAARYFMLHR